MIVVEKNPLDDLKALSKMDMVIYRGNVIDKPQVKKNAQIEEWLDSNCKMVVNESGTIFGISDTMKNKLFPGLVNLRKMI